MKTLSVTRQNWSENIQVQFDNRELLNLDKGDLRNYHLVNGKPELKDGSWLYLFDSGEIFGKGTYEKGFRVGAWQFFHENGVMAQRGFYKSDGTRFHGDDKNAYLWKIYNEVGVEVEDQDYNENWIEEAQEFLDTRKKRWPWIDDEN